MKPIFPDIWVGICQTCGACKQFGNPQTRDMWITHHPHTPKKAAT